MQHWMNDKAVLRLYQPEIDQDIWVQKKHYEPMEWKVGPNDKDRNKI